MTAYNIVNGQQPILDALTLDFRIQGANMAKNLREDFVKFLFLKTTPAWFNVSVLGGSRPDFYISLHDGDPGEAGTQATNEISYAGYSAAGRAQVARTSGGWTVANPSADIWSSVNAAAIAFGVSTHGSTYPIADLWIGLGTSGTVGAAGNLLWRAQYGATGTSSITNLLEQGLADMLFGGSPPAWDGNTWTMGAATPLYMGISTAAVTSTGTQATNEVAAGTFVNYQRGSVASWNIFANGTAFTAASNADAQCYSAPIACGASTTSGTYCTMGASASGAGRLLAFGAIANPISIVNGSTPTFFAGNVQASFR